MASDHAGVDPGQETESQVTGKLGDRQFSTWAQVDAALESLGPPPNSDEWNALSREERSEASRAFDAILDSIDFDELDRENERNERIIAERSAEWAEQAKANPPTPEEVARAEAVAAECDRLTQKLGQRIERHEQRYEEDRRRGQLRHRARLVGILRSARTREAAPTNLGRAPRQASNAHRRGSRRITGSGTTSSGEDDPGDEPPPGLELRRRSPQPNKPAGVAP
jgi:hypothetical protein